MGKLTAVIVSCIGLLFIVSYGDACKCNIDHPQRKYCESDFAFVGTITDIDLIDFDGKKHFEYVVRVTRKSIYKGRRFLSGNRNSQSVLTPYYGSLCGRPDLVRDQEYFISGSVEKGGLMISYCDWVTEWEKVTNIQKNYLRKGIYDDNCDCKVNGTNRRQTFDQNLHSDFVSDIQFSGLWSQRDCYYNPLASAYFKGPDCETDTSYCSFDVEAGRCLWKWVDQYSTCFREREILWQYRNGAQAAFRYRRQCREVSNPKLKRVCRRAVLKQKKLEKRLRKQQLQEQRDQQRIDGGLDLDLD